jgi:hypothetical protein
MMCADSCKRCGGDLYRSRDTFGSYITCFQCVYLLGQEGTEAIINHLANTSAAAGTTDTPTKQEEPVANRRLWPHRAA